MCVWYVNEMRTLTDSDEQVRLELGDFLCGLADELVYLVVRRAQMLWLGHSWVDCYALEERVDTKEMR